MLARGPPVSVRGLLHRSGDLLNQPETSCIGCRASYIHRPMYHLGPLYIGQGVSCAGKEGPLVSARGLLYQSKGLLYWPGASCVVKWAFYIGQGASYTNHGISCIVHTAFCNRGPPVYTRRHHVSTRVSFYIPGASCVGQKGLLCWSEGLLYQAKGALYRTGGLLCRSDGPYHAKDLVYSLGASYIGEKVLDTDKRASCSTRRLLHRP